MRKAFGYVRVSSAGQAGEDRGGIPRQREAIKKYAAANGLRIVEIFEDPISGTKDMENRPDFQRMLTALLANGVKIVIVERLDRLARDLMLQEKIIADFKHKKFELISTAEPDLCTDDPSRVLMRQIMGAFAQYERAMIVAKTQAAKQLKRATDPNYREGRRPYGQDSQEQKIIKHILELRASGMTLTAIARKLEEDKIKTRDGLAVWQPRTVLTILNRAKS